MSKNFRVKRTRKSTVPSVQTKEQKLSRTPKSRKRRTSPTFQTDPKYLIAVDTETTGLDIYHGCRPFLVSMYGGDGTLHHWEWPVDPFTRKPEIPPEEFFEVQMMLDDPTITYIFHNSKFDLHILSSAGFVLPFWHQIHDTIMMSHAIASLDSHGLKDLAIQYLDIPDTDEEELKQEIKRCIPIARSLGWNLAHKKHPMMPTISKAEWWKTEMWLPAALKRHAPPSTDVEDDAESKTQTYARMDVIRTYGIYTAFAEALEEEGLEDQYKPRRDLVRVVSQMEDVGITANTQRMGRMHRKLNEQIVDTRQKALAHHDCINNLNSPKQIGEYLYKHLKLPVLARGKTGPSSKKVVLERLLERDISDRSRDFINHLMQYRKLTKGIEYLDSYRRGGIKSSRNWVRLHPDFNITGTKTTRFSCSNPNAQNISKQKGINLREIFGPTPGREWYAIDYSNIELRIFAHGCGDRSLIAAFESGESVHLRFCEALYPDLYADCTREGVKFKDSYPSLYQCTKNGNFSLIYGAKPSTADATYKLPGAYNTIRDRMPLIDDFIQDKNLEGKKNGYVTLLGGYRLQVPPSEPHKAANYFVQGSAGWAITNAMIRVEKFLQSLPDYHMIIQVHDELVFDFPKRAGDFNQQVITHVKHIMEESGTDFGFDLPTEVDLITDNWSNGVDITNTL